MYNPDQIYHAFTQLRQDIRRRADRYSSRRRAGARLIARHIGQALRTLAAGLRRGARHAEQIVLDSAFQPH